jgi:hypothetical protein
MTHRRGAEIAEYLEAIERETTHTKSVIERAAILVEGLSDFWIVRI